MLANAHQIAGKTRPDLRFEYRRNHYMRCGGTKSFSTPPLQPTLMLLFLSSGQQFIPWVKTNFFIQAFFKTPTRIAVIDLFILKFEYFRNPLKTAKIRDLERFLMEFQKYP